MRRTPLKAKRETPRRNEGRVSHGRIKPKAKAAPTAEEKQHMERVAALGCLVCGAPAAIHHVMQAPNKMRRRDHRFIAPLCPDHHQGDDGVHGLGSEKAFLALWGIDLIEWCLSAWIKRTSPDDLFWTVGVTRMRDIARSAMADHIERAGIAKGNTRSTRPDSRIGDD